MTLFEIEKAIYNFEFEMDEETGEILNAEELDKLNMEKSEKIENVGLWIKNLRAESEAVKTEAKAMTERQKRLEKKADSLEKYLYFATQGQPFATPRLAISFRKSESVEITDLEKIPSEYVKAVTDYKPDKTAIKKAIKGGMQIDGAKLLEKQNISIK